MGVVTKQGVIGVVHSVSSHYAIAISLLHRKSAIGIQLKKNNHNGILKWKGFDYKSATISDFPNHIPINIGDTITTNSHSVIFPEGIHIGTVQNIKQNENVCISFIDILVQKGFQVKGKAKIIDKTNSQFSEIEKILIEMTGGNFPFSTITEITIEQVKPIIAPTSILYPDTTETEQIESAKITYGI